MKAVILAAGRGTRIGELTKIVPKELLPLGQYPVAAHIVRELRDAGVDDIMFVVSQNKWERFVDYFGHSGVNHVYYGIQQQALGPADALLVAEGFIGRDKRFVVALGDTVIWGSNPVAHMIEIDRGDNRVLVEHVDDVRGLGVALIDDRGIVHEVAEKTRDGAGWILCGRYVLDRGIFDRVRGLGSGVAEAEKQLTDALLAEDRTMMGFNLGRGVRFDIGSYEAYEAAWKWKIDRGY